MNFEQRDKLDGPLGEELKQTLQETTSPADET